MQQKPSQHCTGPAASSQAGWGALLACDHPAERLYLGAVAEADDDAAGAVDQHAAGARLQVQVLQQHHLRAHLRHATVLMWRLLQY